MKENECSKFLLDTAGYEFVSPTPIFDAEPLGAVLNHGCVIEVGQYGFPVFPKIFSSGLISLSPRWSEPCYSEYYAKYYSSLYNLEHKPDVGVVGIQENYLAIANWLKKHLHKISGRTMLEVGSGPGIGLSYLMELLDIPRGYAVEGSFDSIQAISRFSNIEFLGSSVDSISSICPRFDFCILRHVVEHMLDPLSEMRKLAALASSDTFFYVAVPDMLNPRTILRDYTDWTEYWFRAPHVHYFNQFTLVELLQLSGFEVLSLEEIDNEVRVLCKKASSINKGLNQISPSVLERQISVLENLLGPQKI